jgi:hypothetical protein
VRFRGARVVREEEEKVQGRLSLARRGKSKGKDWPVDRLGRRAKAERRLGEGGRVVVIELLKKMCDRISGVGVDECHMVGVKVNVPVTWRDV